MISRLRIHGAWRPGSSQYVRGYACRCGALYPAVGDYWPYVPPPDVCPRCGTPRRLWARRSLYRQTWQRRRWWWTQRRYTYSRGRSWDAKKRGGKGVQNRTEIVTSRNPSHPHRFVRRMALFTSLVWRPATGDCGDTWWASWRKYRIGVGTAWDVAGILTANNEMSGGR